MAGVFCLGIATLDYVYSVETMPTRGEKYRSRGLAVVGGGCAGNASVAVARLGGACWLATRLADDLTGDQIVADLERGLPVADRSVDHIFAVQFLEHVHQLLPVLNELHRVLRPEGVLHVMVPHKASVNAWADPTHVRWFHPQTFKFLCRPYPDLRLYYPLIVSESTDNIFADLQPVGVGRPQASEEELARFFN